ncbi:MAG: peroxiredoxin family protein [Chloroflexota bacterium]
MELVDVRDGTTFTLGELAADGPLIVETMAIWCSNCRQQQGEVRTAHDLAEFHSVSIDVDPTEIADDLTAYAERESFDWPFALADADLASMLRDRFGTAVLNPPSMPKLLVRPDGSIELVALGELLAAEEIATLVGG